MVGYKQLLMIGFGDAHRRIKKNHKAVIGKWYSALVALKKDTKGEPIEFDYLNGLVRETEDDDRRDALVNFLASTPKPENYPVPQQNLDYAIALVEKYKIDCR